MIVTTNSLIILSTFIGNILYVEHDNKVRDGFICVSVNNQHNDSWPASWERLNTKMIGHRKLFYRNITIDDTISDISIRIRLYFFNNSLIESNWINIYKFNNKENLYEVLFYITCISVIVLLFCICIIFLKDVINKM